MAKPERIEERLSDEQVDMTALTVRIYPLDPNPETRLSDVVRMEINVGGRTISCTFSSSEDAEYVARLLLRANRHD